MNEIEKEYLETFKFRLGRLRDICGGVPPISDKWRSKYNPEASTECSADDVALSVYKGDDHVPTDTELHMYNKLLNGVLDTGVRMRLVLLPLEMWAQFTLASRKATAFSMFEMLKYKVPDGFGDRLIYPRILDSDWLLIKRMAEYGNMFMECRDMAGQFVDLYDSDYLDDPDGFAKWFMDKYKEVK